VHLSSPLGEEDKVRVDMLISIYADYFRFSIQS
jgi:hypothetical protein